MSTTLTVKATIRNTRGKEKAGKLRKSGELPGIVYGAHKDAVAVTLNTREFDHVRKATHGEQVLIDLALSDGTMEKAFIREVQRHPATQQLLHADFLRVSLTEEITLKVPVLHIGVPEGVKTDGGLLEQVLREVTIRCLPTKVPPHLEYNVSAMRIGHSIHVSDLPAMEGVTFLDDPKAVLFAVVGKMKEDAEQVQAPAATAPEVVKSAKAEKKEAEKGDKK